LSYKNINLTIPEVENLIKEWLKPVNGILKITSKSSILYQFVITIPGQEQALINVYQTKKGLTFDPKVGNNQQLSKKIVEFIITQAEKVRPISQTLKGIYEELLKQFLESLEELEIELIEQKEDHNFKQLKLRNPHKHLLTLNYYPSTEKLVVQGYSNKLFKDVILWFLDKTIESPEEIVKIIFNSIKDFEKYEILFPDKLIDEALQKEIGDHYKNDKFLKETERKWLKVSYYLLKFERNLPDYYPSISASLKVIEGVLRRILINRFGWQGPFNPKSKAILAFDFNEQQQKWELKSEYKNKFNPQQITLMEDLYYFFKHTRNLFSHNEGIPDISALSTIKQAQEIFDEIIGLLKRLKETFPKGI